ncbi:hypothetical protein GRF29_112g262738 [Pseudopithomyces chartarum]|uniref:AB hydrolase-1 domain-containing protein n=1 Tax=Pseudopithomyces chartarum TaxID=1892770 RepID=A0AAN6LSQ2_9PLEO|nr:hypothetical protein GRF29_112g262738 [Pseudopithomyces chartarum]
MARKDLLRKAFRNNFLRKSVADLKSLASDKAHASFTNLRSPHKLTPSKQPIPTHRPATPDAVPTPPTAVTESDSSSSERTVTPTPDPTAQHAEPLRPGASLRVSTPEPSWREEKAAGGRDPMRMTAKEIRGEMDEADAHTATLRTAALLRSHAHLLSDCRHVLALVENMVLEHVDTIQTAFTLLDAMEGMSPHVEGVRKEMVGKLEGLRCCAHHVNYTHFHTTLLPRCPALQPPSTSTSTRSPTTTMIRESDTLTLPDARILSFATYGSPVPSTSVFYFHSFASSRKEGKIFHTAAAKLGIRLVCPDRPGLGNSSPQPDRTFLDWPEDVLALAEHLKIRRFYVLGWSGGGPPVISKLSLPLHLPHNLPHDHNLPPRHILPIPKPIPTINLPTRHHLAQMQPLALFLRDAKDFVDLGEEGRTI